MKQFIYICMILKVSFDVVVVVGSLRAGAETLVSRLTDGRSALLCSALLRSCLHPLYNTTTFRLKSVK